jgi:hypothetical protein
MNKLMAFISVVIISTFVVVGVVACFHFAPIITTCALIFIPFRREIIKRKLEKEKEDE